MPPQLDYQSAAAKPDGGALRAVTLTLILLATVGYVLTFGRDGGLGAVAFFAPFTLLPFAVSAVLAVRWRTAAGQSVLLAATLAYVAWFAFVYVDVHYLHPDPQGPIAFLCLGVVAAPVLVMFWAVGWILERRRRAA